MSLAVEMALYAVTYALTIGVLIFMAVAPSNSEGDSK